MTHRTASTVRIFMVLLLTLPLTIVPKMAIAGGGGPDKPFKWCFSTAPGSDVGELQRLRLVVLENAFGTWGKVDVVKIGQDKLAKHKDECTRTIQKEIKVQAFLKFKDGTTGVDCGKERKLRHGASKKTSIKVTITKRNIAGYNCTYSTGA